MIGRTGTGEAFRGAHRQAMPCTCLELAVREAHLGQRSKAPQPQAGHMSASDPSQSNPTLQAGGRPHMSTGSAASRLLQAGLT